MPNYRVLVRSLIAWFAKHARDMPWRRTHDPYAIWISEIMLQQTQVKTVIPYWERWMRKFPTIHALSTARTETVLRLWAGLGYYSRAQNLKRAARKIRNEYAGDFPSNFNDVLALPGVGPYTAGAICSIAFNQPTPVVDCNVVRVLSRVLAIRTNPRRNPAKEQIWKAAAGLVQTASLLNRSGGSRNCSHLNQALMELGATVCAPRDPDCPRCPLRKQCAANTLGCTALIPALAPRPKSTPREFAAFVVSHQGNYLIRKRAKTGINARLWEFPNAEFCDTAGSIASAARKCLGFATSNMRPIGTILHTITQNRICLRVFSSEEEQCGRNLTNSLRWCSVKQIQKLPFPSAHRQILRLLQNPKPLTR
ncbi:MAG: A/G-specific adenine glycosylase [Verrucomicrobia bacterium]|nr:A/G-specific adenine glycosylase [Verrucomicrobiota bacterium]